MPGLLTQQAIYATPGDAFVAAGKILKLVAVSEGLASDAGFARQARRKFF